MSTPKSKASTLPSQPEPGDLLFVYGTLKKGYWNHRLLGASELIAPAKTMSHYPMIDIGYPKLYLEVGQGHKIVGEVYRVDGPETWANLDRLEGVPVNYSRTKIQVDICRAEQAKERTLAWVYHGSKRDEKVPLIHEWHGQGATRELRQFWT